VPARRFLLTGGAGFIGSHIAERLAPEHELVLFDNFRRDSLSEVPHLRSNPRVSIVQGDILDAESLGNAMKGVDTVVHLAAMAGVSSYYTEATRTLRVNLLGTINALQQAAEHRITEFLYFSTSEVFGPDAMFVNELSSCGIGPSSEPRWTYATSKLAGEQFALRMAEEAGFRTVILRPFNVYGPRQTGEGAISNFIRAGLTGQPLVVHGDGSEIRAWCFVDDMVDAVAAVLDLDLDRNESFNIGNPHAIATTLGLAEKVADLLEGAVIKFEQVTRASVRARTPDTAKARQMLGFQARVSLEEGLRRTISWYRDRRTI
jgi:nucleoside-diphosphate-sugar epimerase